MIKLSKDEELLAKQTVKRCRALLQRYDSKPSIALLDQAKRLILEYYERLERNRC